MSIVRTVHCTSSCILHHTHRGIFAPRVHLNVATALKRCLRDFKNFILASICLKLRYASTLQAIPESWYLKRIFKGSFYETESFQRNFHAGNYSCIEHVLRDLWVAEVSVRYSWNLFWQIPFGEHLKKCRRGSCRSRKSLNSREQRITFDIYFKCSMIHEFWTREEVAKLPPVRPCGFNVRTVCTWLNSTVKSANKTSKLQNFDNWTQLLAD